ncbi:MAG: glycosyltransferase involved in cell wall biosynthesis [Candidatus Marinamargulisbacteria bacterium]|jgi:glycosyltransferase involved in cell wall biosynthesis
MTKLIIQIPAFNEESALPVTLSKLPREMPGISVIEWLVIDDGSTDQTSRIAKQCGADHVVRLIQNQGLAKAFMAGIEASLREGADIIVNTDADNQYCAEDIIKLVTPILENKAEIVIGERPIQKTSHFSFLKKFLQRMGSGVIRYVSKTSIPDAPSGFRAISRRAALRLNVFNEFTYTLEMIIQAGKQGIAISSVPINTNEMMRPSRLMKSIPQYIQKSIFTMIRVFNTYKPLRFFLNLSAIPIVAGIILGIRWIVFFMGQPASHIPSLILVAILILIGVQLCIFGFMADLISVNRKLLEEVQLRTREMALEKPRDKKSPDRA